MPVLSAATIFCLDHHSFPLAVTFIFFTTLFTTSLFKNHPSCHCLSHMPLTCYFVDSMWTLVLPAHPHSISLATVAISATCHFTTFCGTHCHLVLLLSTICYCCSMCCSYCLPFASTAATIVCHTSDAAIYPFFHHNFQSLLRAPWIS